MKISRQCFSGFNILRLRESSWHLHAAQLVLQEQIKIPGMNPPKPLRTLEEPDGISTLSGLDLVRVSAANVLYSFCAEVLELCCLLDKLFMLGKPSQQPLLGDNCLE